MGGNGTINHDDLQARADRNVAPGKLKQPDPVDVRTQSGLGYKTGSAYVDQGPGCDGTGQMDATCFLEAAQRTRLVNAFQQRVLAAQTHYISALDEIRVDQLLEKDEDLSWVVDLILNAVFIGAGTALSKALAAFRDTKVIENAFMEAELKVPVDFEQWRNQAPSAFENSAATKLAQSFHGLSDASIGLVVKQAVDSGKKTAKSTAMAMSTEEHKTDKSSKLDYVSFLKDQSGTVFQHIREDTPARVHDDALLALFKSYEAMNHTPSVYKKVLKEQVDTYAKSFVARIGYSKPKDAAHAGLFDLNEHPDKKVVKCVWLIETGKKGPPTPKLVYQTFMIGWKEEKGGDHYARVGDVDYHEVEHSLIDAALARNIQIWGHPAETIVVDASYQPTWKKKDTGPKKPWDQMSANERITYTQGHKDVPENEEGK